MSMDDIKELSAAMAKAFPSIEGAIKGKANPAFRSKYADLSSVIDAIKPALAEHGLWFRQVTHHADGGVCVETVIHHASGQLMPCGPLFVPATKQDAQGFGSALTYCRRYSLMTAFGVPAEDDDGNAASGRTGSGGTGVQARQNGAQQPDAESDKHRAIREAADACIAAHAAAVVMLDKEGSSDGFWELHRVASRVMGEDRMILWEMLSKHSAVRAAIKEYAGYAAAEKKAAA
jgi:hypothetical protein